MKCYVQTGGRTDGKSGANKYAPNFFEVWGIMNLDVLYRGCRFVQFCEYFSVSNFGLNIFYFDNNIVNNKILFIQLGIRTKAQVFIKFFSQKQWTCIHNGDFQTKYMEANTDV